MVNGTRTLTLLVVLAAPLASAMTYTVTSLAQPSAATASGKQIVNAIGTSEFDGNSIRNDLRKTIGASEFQGLRGQVHDMCRALAETPIDC